MRKKKALPICRALQIGGLSLTSLSLASYWAASAGPTDTVRLVRPNIELKNGKMPSFTGVLAGRDINYCGYHAPCKGKDRYGKRTDTIMFFKIDERGASFITIPRDTQVTDSFGTHKINASFAYGGADGLKKAVESLIGISVDYHVIVPIEAAEKTIDAMGGVDVYFDKPMKYTDTAANLYIDFPAGNLHLDGKQTVDMMRFRHDVFADYTRQERTRNVLSQLLNQLKKKSPLDLLPVLPDIMQDVETNIDLSLIQAALPHLKGIKATFSALPTIESHSSTMLMPDRFAINRQIDSILNEQEKAKISKEQILIINASGSDELGLAISKYIEKQGAPTPRIIKDDSTSSPTQILRSQQGNITDANYYAQLFDLIVNTPHVFPDKNHSIAIHLGHDALEKYATIIKEMGVN